MDHQRWVLRRERFALLDTPLNLEEGSVITFGRPYATVNCFSDFISRNHCRIYCEKGILHIEDCGSTNGTFLNKSKILGKRELRLNDLVGLGCSELTPDSTAENHFVFKVTLPEPELVIVDDSDSDAETKISFDPNSACNNTSQRDSNSNPPIPPAPVCVPPSPSFVIPAKVLTVPPPPKISYVEDLSPEDEIVIIENQNAVAPPPQASTVRNSENSLIINPPLPAQPLLQSLSTPLTVQVSQNGLNTPSAEISSAQNLVSPTPTSVSQGTMTEEPIISDGERPSSSKALRMENAKNSSRKREKQAGRIVSSSSSDDSSDGMSSSNSKSLQKKKRFARKETHNRIPFVNNAGVMRNNRNENVNGREQNCSGLIKKQWNSTTKSDKKETRSNGTEKESSDIEIITITLDDDDEDTKVGVANTAKVLPTEIPEPVSQENGKKSKDPPPENKPAAKENLEVRGNQKSTGTDKNEKEAKKSEPTNVKEPKRKRNEEEESVAKKKKPEPTNKNDEPKRKRSEEEGSVAKKKKKETYQDQEDSRIVKDKHQENTPEPKIRSADKSKSNKGKEKTKYSKETAKVSTQETHAQSSQSSIELDSVKTTEVKIILPRSFTESEGRIELRIDPSDRANLSPACIRKLRKQYASLSQSSDSSSDRRPKNKKSDRDEREKIMKKPLSKDKDAPATNDPRNPGIASAAHNNATHKPKHADAQPTNRDKEKAKDQGAPNHRSKDAQPQSRSENLEKHNRSNGTQRQNNASIPSACPLNDDKRLEELKKRMQEKPVADKAPKILDYSPAPRKLRGQEAPRTLERNMSREYHRQNLPPPQPQPISPAKESDERSKANAKPGPFDKKARLKEIAENEKAAKAQAELSKQPVEQRPKAPLRVKTCGKSRQDGLFESLASTATVPPSLERRPSLNIPDSILENRRPSVDQVVRIANQSSRVVVENELSKIPQQPQPQRMRRESTPASTSRPLTPSSSGNGSGSPPRISGKNLSLVYRDVLKWTTDWLTNPPKKATVITGHREIITNLPAYENYESYLKTFYLLMLLELWEKVYRTYKQQGETDTKSEMEIGVESEKHEDQCPMLIRRYRGVGPSEQSWYLIKVTALVNSRSEVEQQNDFGTITLPVIGNLGYARQASFFGFFLKHTEKFELIKPETTIHSRLQEQSKKKTLKYTIDVLTSLQGSKLVIDQLGRMQRFALLDPMLQTFHSISLLPILPMMKNVLQPEAICSQAPPGEFVVAQNPAFGVFNLLQGSQRDAVLDIGARVFGDQREELELLLVNGGPGTGKTLTIAGMISYLLRFNQHSDQPRRPKPRLLICAPTSVALDSVIRQICSSLGNFRLVRLGKGSDDTKEFTLDILARQVEKGQDDEPIKQKIFEWENRITEIRNSKKGNKHKYESELAQLTPNLERAYLGLKEWELEDAQRRRTILLNADIVCATMSSCSDPLMQKNFGTIPMGDERTERFTCCIVDDASLATEPESLVPLTLKYYKLVLFGDAKQHRPIVMSKEAEKKDYHQSLFLRLINIHQNSTARSPVLNLDVQFRMDPYIFNWSNMRFYRGTITSHESLRQRKRLNTVPYLFLDIRVPSKEEEDFSISTELLVVKNLLDIITWQETRVRNHIGLNIGIITPNIDHKNALLRLIADPGVGESRKWKSVEVSTVDEVRGRENDIVILFCVNIKETNPFMTSEDLNVALTRAKRCLYIVGNSSRLKEDEIWHNLMTDAKHRNLFKAVTEAKITSQGGCRAFLEKYVVVPDN